MAFVEQPESPWASGALQQFPVVVSPSPSNYDAVNEGWGSCVVLHPGEIIAIGVRIHIVSSPNLTVEAGIYGQLPTGLPDFDNPLGGMVPGSLSNPSATFHRIVLATPCVLAAPTKAVIVTRISARTSGNIQVSLLELVGCKFPYKVTSAGSWGKSSGGCVHIVEYSDGRGKFLLGTVGNGPAGINAQIIVGDEGGAKIKPLPFSVRCVGVQFNAWTVQNRAGTYYFRDEDDEIIFSIDKTSSLDLETVLTSGSIIIPLPAPITLDAGKSYRVTFAPTDSTQSVGVFDGGTSVPWLDQLIGKVGDYVCYTRRTGNGAWTDFDGVVPLFGIVIDAIDIPSGGGGGISASRLVGGI